MNQPVTPLASVARLAAFPHFKQWVQFIFLMVFFTAVSSSAKAERDASTMLTSDTTITATICANETYPFDGQMLNVSGVYTAVYSGSDGSDSTVNLQLTVLPLLSENIFADRCAGESYLFNGVAYDTTGTYSVVLQGSNGCDSTVVLHLTIHPQVTKNLTAGICSGTDYVFLGDTLTESGTYTALLQTTYGCDSLVRLKLDVVDYFDIQQVATICHNETYIFGSDTLGLSGVYVDSLVAIGGCDSTVTLTLTVLPAQGSELHVAICDMSSYVFHGDTLTVAGDYFYHTDAANGCDSLVTLHLETVTSFETSAEATICQGETFTLGTQVLDTDGVFKETFTAVGGCDSIVTLTLTVLPVLTGTASATICDGQSYEYQGVALSEPGEHLFVLAGSNGCDSIVTFTLTVLETPNTVLEAVICHEETYFFYGDQLNESGVYEQVFQAENGCDSTVSLILTVLPALTASINASICAGSTYDFNGEILDQSGSYSQVLPSEFGCDSTVTVNLTVLPNLESTVNHTICANTSYDFNGQTLTETGVYKAVLTGSNGCDSTVTLNLEVLPLLETSVEATICQGSVYVLNNIELTESGEYSAVFTSSTGCDSTVTVKLTVLPTHSTTLNETICEGSGYDFFGQVLTEAGSYEFALTGSNGCDSTILINLSVTPLTYGSTDITICAGQSYIFNGEELSETGTYQFAFPGANGCDSIFLVYLTVHPVYMTVLNESLCTGQTYPFHGANLTLDGQYIAEYTSIYGCDSTVVLNLTFVNQFASSLQASVCAGESYVFGADTLTASGEYQHVYPAAGGCDSTVTLVLTVLPAVGSSIEATICAGESYDFNGTALTASGVYTAILSAFNGCDSTAVVNLTVLPTVTNAISATICSNETYSFGGAMLTESGEYTEIVTGANGCDSTTILTLTVLPAVTSSISATICEGQTYAFNGLNLDASGSYSAVYATSYGCDSLVSLTLTVLPTPHSSVVETVCNGGTFTFNGQVLSESGTYAFTVSNGASNGCDSIVTLSLTIHPPVTPTEINASICFGESYAFNGSSYGQSGDYVATLPTATGCDSVVVLHLTVLPSPVSNIIAAVCQGDSYEFGGLLLTQAGVYSAVYPTANGCDSTVMLTLTINPLPAPVVTLANGTLSLVNPENLVYQWINCATNQVIPGAFGSSYTPTVTGSYAVMVTNIVGCTGVSACTSVVISAVHEPMAAFEWQLQPNPAQAHASVILKTPFSESMKLEIFDPAGRLLHQEDLVAGVTHVDLDLTNYPDGMLMIRLVGKEGAVAKMLMKGN